MTKNYVFVLFLLGLACSLYSEESRGQCTATITTSSACGGVPALLKTEMNRAIQYLEWARVGTGVIRRDTAVHTTNGVRIFGTGAQGNALNQMFRPGPVFLHENGDLYVGEEGNHRVMRWAPGATSGVVVAGHATAGSGSGLDRLNNPQGLYVGTGDTVYVLEFGNGRITKWGPGATQGMLVVGGMNTPIAFSVRPDGAIYVAELNGMKVIKFPPGSTTSTLVENTSNGCLSLAFDPAGDMYVALGNGVIRKYPQGATPATNIITGPLPRGIMVDKNFNLWVAESDNNRVVCYGPGSTVRKPVVGDGTSGSGAHQLMAATAMVIHDSTGDLYVSDYNNHRVQKYTARINDTLTAVVTGQHTITARGFSGCTATANIVVSAGSGVGITPGANPSVCAGADSVLLPYSSPAGTPDQYSITWSTAAQTAGFTAVTNQPLPGGSIRLAIPSGASSGNTYTGSLTVRNATSGCASTAYSFSVTVTTGITVTPGSNPAVCTGSTAASLSYTATGTPNQYSIAWSTAAQTAGFSAMTNQAASGGSVGIVVPAAATPGTYGGTLTMRNSSSGCISAASNIAVVVHARPAATVSPSGSADICVGQTMSLTAGSGTGYNYEWKNAGATVGSGASYSAGAAGSYYVVVTDGNNCRDSSSAVAITEVALPQVSITPGDTAFCDGGFARLEAVTPDTGISYHWKDGSSLLPATADFVEINATGLYSVVVTRNHVAHCKDSAQPVQVTVYPLPVPTVNWDGTILTTATYYDTYQWYTGSQPIVAATNASYRPDTVGFYAVMVTDSNGCSAQSAVHHVSEINGISVAGSAQPVVVYPNPAAQHVYIGGPAGIHAVLSSMDGKEMYRLTDAGHMDISMLPEGVYLLRITNADGVLLKSERLIKAGR